MYEYLCFRCGYQAKQRGHLKNHLQRKITCKPLLDDISITEIQEYYNFEKLENKQLKAAFLDFSSSFKHPKAAFLDNPSSFKHPKAAFLGKNNNEMNEMDEMNKNLCEYCNKNFTRMYGLTKHLRICKKKKEYNQLILSENNKDNKIKELEEKIKELNKNTNIINQEINNHNIINTNNITINNYGEENIDHLNKQYLLKLFTRTYRAIPLLVEKVHFDNEHPENQNIRLTNKKLPYIEIRKNNKWMVVDRKSELLNLIDAMCFILSENYHIMKDNNTLPKQQKDIINKYLDAYRHNNKELIEQLTQHVDLTLINNSKKKNNLKKNNFK